MTFLPLPLRQCLGACFALVSIACTTFAATPTTLKEAYEHRFLIGIAINESQFANPGGKQANLVRQNFTSISPENVLKWGPLQPKPGVYDFSGADRYVAFGEQNGLVVIGHNLVWHWQTPSWLFKDDAGQPVDRATLLGRMRAHIYTVVGRYRGRIRGWDVVNEAIEEDGTIRQSPWMKIIGEDYIEQAYRFAHEADPSAELYYNEYGLEDEAKLRGAVALVKRLQQHGIPLAGVGLQSHVSLSSPTKQQFDREVRAFADLGLKVMITELDVDPLPAIANPLTANVSLNEKNRPELDPYTQGFPPEMQQRLAARYAELFQWFQMYPGVITRVTLWGLQDGESWLNGWPVKGRTSYPLLWDRNLAPKPAFYAVLKAADSGR